MTYKARSNSIFPALFVILAGVAGVFAGARADEIQISYNLAAGASSASFAVPAVNTPVSLTCTQNSPGFSGVGQVTILRNLQTNDDLIWAGVDFASGAVVHGASQTAGTHIVYCDGFENVDLRVVDGAHFLVDNTRSATAYGVITLVW